jgi:DNA mismatch repair protein MutL
MADLIRLLPDHVANQIAAGEVVQRPASVVKELLENSVDAGADSITLVAKDAGRTLIQVTDNGRGMGATDARLCFERHATSKIRSAEDLGSVTTKGFRGEALASIAAVAQVELRTREHDQDLGFRVLIEGSRVKASEPMATQPGTTIAVRNLFFNIPARRQFLKSDSVEFKHVLEEFQRVALAHPDIAFRLVHNEQEVFQLPVGNPRQRIVGLQGRKYDERLVPVDEGTDVVRVHGFTGKPEFARRTRGEQYFFVNRRYIRSAYLEHAVRQAYEELVPRDQHPGWYLYLEIDPSRIDINIHPTKTEIKFIDDRAVYAIVHAGVRRALGRFNIVPSLDFEPEPAIIAAFSGGGTATVAPTVPAWRPNDLGAFHAPPRQPVEGWQRLFDLGGGDVASSAPPASGPEPAVRTLPWREGPDEGGERAIFQLHGTYIIAQSRSGFLVVHQRRAHERILYERNLRLLEQGTGASQTELFPRVVELTPTDMALLGGVLPELRAMGLDLEHFGSHSLRVNGMPAEAADDDPGRLIGSVLEQLRNQQGSLRNDRHRTLARGLARSMALRPGRPLTRIEMLDLIDRLFACDMPTRSPSGETTLITFGLNELDERFDP